MTPKEALDFLVKNLPLEAQQTTSIYHPAIRVLLQSINELERLKKFKETFDNYELAKKQDFIAYENWLECEKELNELKCVSDEIKAICNKPSETMILSLAEISKRYIEIDNLINTFDKVGDKE